MSRPGPAMRLAAIFVLAGLANSSLLCSPVIALQLARQFAYSPERIGWFFSAEYVGYIVAGLAGRVLMPRLGWRRIATVAMAGAVIGNLIAVALLDHFMALIALRVATASCSALVGTVVIATANESPHPSRAISACIMGQLATGVVGLALLPGLFGRYGVQAYFIGLAMLLLGSAGGILWLADRKSPALSPGVWGQGGDAARWIGLLRYPTILLFYIGLGGIWTFATMIAKVSMAGPDTLAWMLPGATVAGVVGGLVAGMIGKRGDVRMPIMAGFGLLLLGTAALLIRAEAAFLAGIVTIKFAWSLALPFTIALIGRLDGDGRLIAEMTVLAGIGLAAGPAIAGYLVGRDASCVTMLWCELLFLALSAASVVTMAVRMGAPDRVPV